LIRVSPESKFAAEVMRRQPMAGLYPTSIREAQYFPLVKFFEKKLLSDGCNVKFLPILSGTLPQNATVSLNIRLKCGALM
jgi:hypothetical protein